MILKTKMKLISAKLVICLYVIATHIKDTKTHKTKKQVKYKEKPMTKEWEFVSFVLTELGDRPSVKKVKSLWQFPEHVHLDVQAIWVKF